MRRVKSAGSFKTVKPRRRFFPATAIKTSCRALAMSMATQTGASCAITISVTVGLLCGVVCCKNHCRDLRRGDDHLLRYLGAAQAVIASQPDEARCKLALWRYDDNNVRPHSSRENQTLVEARRALEQFEGSAQAALAQTDDEEYETQTRKLSL